MRSIFLRKTQLKLNPICGKNHKSLVDNFNLEITEPENLFIHAK